MKSAIVMPPKPATLIPYGVLSDVETDNFHKAAMEDLATAIASGWRTPGPRDPVAISIFFGAIGMYTVKQPTSFGTDDLITFLSDFGLPFTPSIQALGVLCRANLLVQDNLHLFPTSTGLAVFISYTEGILAGAYSQEDPTYTQTVEALNAAKAHLATLASAQ